jgi:hypothetical protein
MGHISHAEDALLDASKEINLEVNAEKTYNICMFMSHHQAAGQNHNITIILPVVLYGRERRFHTRGRTQIEGV